MSRRLVQLDANRCEFPSPTQALRDPNGLLAVGGDLSVKRLLAAYSSGIFPWFDDDLGPILWWSPDPRAVLLPHELHVSRSLQRRLRSGGFSVTLDRAFAAVMQGCAAPRAGSTGTWITARMRRAYQRLYRAGYAHSIEVWQQDELVGGLYGVSLGRMFFGESMFSRAPDASKVALVALLWQIERWGFTLLDCQVMNPHLRSLGAREIPRSEFLERLAQSNRQPTRKGVWQMDEDGSWHAGRTG
ncbi:MAG: leucyl/phenylalanyl-tRNA--protein transferase [Pseudomonadales bacterium]